MQIATAQVGNIVYSLVEGQPIPIVVGETVRVSYAFKYKMPKTTSVRIWASLYYYTLLGFFEREGRAQTKQTITLQESLEWKDYSSEIDIVVGEVAPDIYGLIIELPDYGVQGKVEASIKVAAAPSVWDSIIPLITIGLMIGLMSGIMPEEELD